MFVLQILKLERIVQLCVLLEHQGAYAPCNSSPISQLLDYLNVWLRWLPSWDGIHLSRVIYEQKEIKSCEDWPDAGQDIVETSRLEVRSIANPQCGHVQTIHVEHKCV